MVVCKECGERLKQITNTHLLNVCKSKLTLHEYMIKHNLSYFELMDNVTKEKRIDSYKNRDIDIINKKIYDNKKKKQISFDNLTNEEKQILIGTLLGDGYIHNAKKVDRYGCLILEHGVRQISYLLWKGSKLNRLGCKFHQNLYFSKVTNRIASSNRIISKSSVSGVLIGELAKKFYNKNGKIINKELLYQLDDLGVAIWYIDDGGINPSGSAELYTQSFSLDDNKIIIDFFKKKFSIIGYIYKNFKNQPTIRFTVKESKKLFKLIKPYMLSQFLYKIGEGDLCKCVVSKKFDFDAAHFLEDHPAKCNNLHGGRWSLWVSVKGIINPETGMVIDYGYLKKVVDTYIVDRADHSFLNTLDSSLSWRSTTEILCLYFWSILVNLLPGLYKLELYETPNSKCSFYGPSLDDFKWNKENSLVKMLNSFKYKNITKERLNIKINNLLDNEQDNISVGFNEDGRGK